MAEGTGVEPATVTSATPFQGDRLPFSHPSNLPQARILRTFIAHLLMPIFSAINLRYYLMEARKGVEPYQVKFVASPPVPPDEPYSIPNLSR